MKIEELTKLRVKIYNIRHRASAVEAYGLIIELIEILESLLEENLPSPSHGQGDAERFAEDSE